MKILILVISTVGIAALGLAATYLIVERQIANHERKIQEIDTQLASYGGLADQVQVLFSKKNSLEKRLKTIEVLERDRNRTGLILEDIVASIPDEVWLVELREQLGALVLKGYGMTNDDISQFVGQLKESGHFSSIELKFVQAEQASGADIYTFEIDGTVEKP